MVGRNRDVPHKVRRRPVWVLTGLILVLTLGWLGLPTLIYSSGVAGGSIAFGYAPLASPTTLPFYLPLLFWNPSTATPTKTPTQAPTSTGTMSPSAEYIMVGWNDLGMHCYNRNFNDLAVLPPYNTLWAQVIKRGDPPQIVTQGITVEYSFQDNTTSVTKSNFWANAKKIFNLAADLPPDIGLTGRGLTGNMDAAKDPTGAAYDHFIADGIPLTEYTDSNPTVRDPYQLANLVAKNTSTGAVIATLTVVAPVSTEMRCDLCHTDNQQEGIATGVVEQNILTLHDQEEGTHLMAQRAVLCASCHASNALGALGMGQPGIPNLSHAMHSKHDGEVKDTLQGCYSCHPGPTTQCLRDVMSSSDSKMTCIDCHGGLSQVAQGNRDPWLTEPRCETCHDSGAYHQDQGLYRMSRGHGGVYCEACHDSTHAIATSTQPKDAIKFVYLQGHSGTLEKCTVCHLTEPNGPGPHQQ